MSLIKGIEFEDNELKLISEYISDHLNGMSCSVLMGANVANEVAEGQFCETTIGSLNPEHAAVLQRVFQTPRFKVAPGCSVGVADGCR